MIIVRTRLEADFTVAAKNSNFSRTTRAITSSIEPTMSATTGTAKDNLVLVDGVVFTATHDDLFRNTNNQYDSNEKLEF